MSALTPQQFVAHWQNTTLGERQSYQIHFMELCDLVGHERPSGEGVDSHGRRFGFESSIKKDGGGQGFADVFYEGFFAIEYKAPGKYTDLNEAYQQLLQYREKLNNPPLMCSASLPTTCAGKIPTPQPPPHFVRRGSQATLQVPPCAAGRDLGRGSSLSERELKDRTLTNLYNALNGWRGKDKMKIKEAAGDFAPRLDELHNALDKAVCDAYGWPHEILSDGEEILRRLLALNQERARSSPPPSPLPTS